MRDRQKVLLVIKQCCGLCQATKYASTPWKQPRYVPSKLQQPRTCGAPFMTRSILPVALSRTKAMVYLSVGLKGTNLAMV